MQAISGGGEFQQNGPGTTILTAINTYTGATTVNAGALIVNGSIANSAVTVNSGALLAGTGTVGAATINSGGTFAPGNSPGTMTVAGNLAFQSGALYLVQVNPRMARRQRDRRRQRGARRHGQRSVRVGKLRDAHFHHPLSRGRARRHHVRCFDDEQSAGRLHSQSELHRHRRDPEPHRHLPPGALGTGGLSINQRNVATALNSFFNNGGALPPGFVSVFGLTGANLGNALSQLSGEAATGAQQGAFQLTNQFLGLMLDPFVDGRSGVAGAGGPRSVLRRNTKRCPMTSRSPIPPCSRRPR